MTRWIVFGGAPTVQEALDSLETPSDGKPWGEWTTSHFRLGFLPPEEEERARPATQGAQGGPASAVVHPTTASEGDVGDLSSSSDERVDQVAATPSEGVDLCDELDPRCLTDEYRRARPATQGAQGGPASAVVHPTTASEGDVGDLSSSSDERVDQVAATPSEGGDLCDELDPRCLTDEYRRQEISHDDVLDPTSQSSLGRHVKEEDDDSGFPSGGESRLGPEVCVPSQPTYAAS